MGIKGASKLLKGPLGNALSATFPSSCLQANTVCIVDVTSRMFKLVGTHGISLKTVLRKLDAYCISMFKWCETLVLTFEIDPHVPSVKHMVRAERRMKYDPLSGEECVMMQDNDMIPDYNRIRSTPGIRDWLFNTMSEHLRLRFKVPVGKCLVVGPTAEEPSEAYIKDCVFRGPDATDNAEGATWKCMQVPLMGEADISIAFWARHFADLPVVVSANDIDMVAILLLVLYRTVVHIENVKDLRPLYLFRHPEHFADYLHSISSGNGQQTPTLSRTVSGYSTPFTNIHTILHSLYDLSSTTLDPTPVASFIMFLALRGCDFIKECMFDRIATEKLFHEYWKYSGPSFVDLVWNGRNEKATIVGRPNALALFQQHVFATLSKNMSKKCLTGVKMHASIRRALWVLCYWTNGHLGEACLPDPLHTSSDHLSTCGWSLNAENKPAEASQVSATLPDAWKDTICLI